MPLVVWSLALHAGFLTFIKGTYAGLACEERVGDIWDHTRPKVEAEVRLCADNFAPLEELVRSKLVRLRPNPC